jgi:hypothetical protein
MSSKTVPNVIFGLETERFTGNSQLLHKKFTSGSYHEGNQTEKNSVKRRKQ